MLIPNAPGGVGQTRRIAQVQESEKASIQQGPGLNTNLRGIDTSPIARGLEDASEVVFEIQDREDTAAATDIDTRASGLIRKALYDPEVGYMHQQQANAVSGYKDINSRLQEIKTELLNGQPSGVADKVSSLIDQRIQSATESIDRHAARQREEWLTSASSARIQAAADDALAGFEDDAEIRRNIGVGISEIKQRGARLGLSNDQIQLEQREFVSGSLKNVVFRRAQTNPQAAMAYAKRYETQITSEDMAHIESVVGTAAKEVEGRQWGIGAANRSATNSDLQSALVGRDYQRAATIIRDGGLIAQESGGNPLAVSPKGAQGLMQLMPATAKRVAFMLGLEYDESRLTSDPEYNKTLGTALLKSLLTRYDGNVEMALAAYHAGEGAVDRLVRKHGDPRNGVITTGEFMEHFTMSDGHIMTKDYVKQVMGRLGVKRDPYAEAFNTTDPTLREARLAGLKEAEQLRATQVKRQRALIEQTVHAHLERNGSVDDLPVEVRVNLGSEQMAQLRRYETTLKNGRKPVTNPTVYFELSRMSADDPEAFKNLDMILYLNDLDETQWRGFVDQQAKMREGGATKPVTFDGIREALKMVAPGTFDFNAEVDTTAGERSAGAYMAMTLLVEDWQRDNPDKRIDDATRMDMARRVLRQVTLPAGGTLGLFSDDQTLAESVREIEQIVGAGKFYNLRTGEASSRSSDDTISTLDIQRVIGVLEGEGVESPTLVDVVEHILQEKGFIR